MNSILQSKLPNVGTTIFTVMSGLATEYGAINLSQGFPDFGSDEALSELVYTYMKKGMNQYAPMPGIMPLRERIAEKTEALYGYRLNPDTEITVTSGATEALYAAIAAIVRQGDEVIVPEPCYDSYIPAIELNGGTIVPVALPAPDFHINREALAAAISPRTRALIINTPHNPTGAVMSAEDMQWLENLLADTDIFLISDEVYEHIIFSGTHESALKYPRLAERSFVISSFGKTFHVTGWKVGYAVAPAPLMREFRKVHQFLTFSTATPLQYAIADYLKQPEKYLHVPAFYQEKRDKFCALMQETRFRFTPSEGTYFQLADYSAISDEADTDFAVRLTKEIGVATVPVSVFYGQPKQEHLLRFCFAKTDQTLERAVERLAKL
ncbi:methionine aminotransferase [Rhodoflexus caldus]|uniref:methionine aminotransferase n=1 Tax=Rhodoflexus caldus TaxID=2891236 RepID=UPI00202ABB2F|nr:methionine aminotransferase [Rhodoflexus caldus]